MTHYPVLVCLDPDVPPDQVDAALHDSLAPYDENSRVDTYRAHLDGAAADHPLAAELRVRGWGLRDRPDRPLTWAQVADAHNAEYGHDTPDDPERLWVDDGGRPYQLSTYNPLSRWDWFAVGGRWSPYFLVAAGTGPDDLIQPRNGRCDGGRRATLDLTAMRNAAQAAGEERYHAWEAVCADTPPARPWSQFADRVRAGDLTLDRARTDYQKQPRIGAARRVLGWDPFDGCPVDEFRDSRQAYIDAVVAATVPGYALLLPPTPALSDEQRWLAPGRMGWFGQATDSQTDRDAYHAAANQHLDDLHPQAWLVAVDLHI